MECNPTKLGFSLQAAVKNYQNVQDLTTSLKFSHNRENVKVPLTAEEPLKEHSDENLFTEKQP